MIGSRSSLARPVAVLVALSASACGLRSDPFAPDYVLDDDTVGDDSNDPGDPNRPGTCNDPLPMSFSPMTYSGELSGPSFSEGWCGTDGGPEDIYVLTPEYDVDVMLSVIDSGTDFPPTLRVVENGCEPNTGFTQICARDFASQDYHFLARAGSVYSIIIDSPADSEGGYEISVDLGTPSLDQCSVHPETIQQIPGSAFLWNNDFSQGQGQVDGYCGGPGRENMFRLQATYPGNMFATVETTDGFAPVISLRTGCAALSEQACDSAGAGQIAQLGYFIAQPGEYFLVVDQAQIGSGGYSLRVDFE